MGFGSERCVDVFTEWNGADMTNFEIQIELGFATLDVEWFLSQDENEARPSRCTMKINPSIINI